MGVHASASIMGRQHWLLKQVISKTQDTVDQEEGLLVLEILSDDDPRLEPFKEKLSRHVRQAEMLRIPYWVFFECTDPIGVVDVGQEPVMLLEPPGTPLSTVRAVDPERQMETLKEFATRSLKAVEGERCRVLLF